MVVLPCCETDAKEPLKPSHSRRAAPARLVFIYLPHGGCFAAIVFCLNTTDLGWEIFAHHYVSAGNMPPIIKAHLSMPTLTNESRTNQSSPIKQAGLRKA